MKRNTRKRFQKRGKRGGSSPRLGQQVDMDDLIPGTKYYIQYVKGKNGLPGLSFRHPNSNKLEIGTFEKIVNGVVYFSDIHLANNKRSISATLKRSMRPKKWYYDHPENEGKVEARLDRDFDFYQL
jgi:hypothetical protein